MLSVQSCRSQDAKPFVQKAKRAILLSGTPASGRPRELFPLVKPQLSTLSNINPEPLISTMD